jgi:inosine/xanthosine triphosphatase
VTQPLTRDTPPGAQILVVVGSENPVKCRAVAAVFARWHGRAAVVPARVASGVPDQPWGDAETQAGALARARAALASDAAADFGVGLEGGVVREPDGSVRTCAWAAVVDRAGQTGLGGSLALPLPPAVIALLDCGVELGHAMDQVAQTSGTKTGRGAVGLLTAALIDRQAAYEPLVTYALSRWLAPSFWEPAAGAD